MKLLVILLAIFVCGEDDTETYLAAYREVGGMIEREVKVILN